MTGPFAPSLPHTPLPSAALVDKLREHAPLWAMGTEEPGHQRALAGALLRAAGAEPGLAAVAAGLLLWSWQQRPLQTAALMPLRDLDRAHPFLAEPCRRLARTLADRLDAGADTTGLDDLLASEDHARTLRTLLPLVGHPEQGLAWLAGCWDFLMRLGREDLPPALLDAAPFDPATEPLKARLTAEWALHYRPAEEALGRVRGLDAAVFAPHCRLWEAELLLRLGQREAAVDLLATLWRAMPANAAAGLKLHALARPVPQADPAGEDVCVLLYSWNKAGLVARVLDRLAGTDLGGAPVFVLDNGSTDHMAAVLEDKAALFGADRFFPISLPVNVGAPAARNWLLSLPRVRACAWAAFLDDDALPEADWLARLLGAARSRPAPPGAVGCRITSAKTPVAMQSADYHLFPPRPGHKTFSDMEERIMVFENCGGQLDDGRFAYRRPAASVSGCCHLLHMPAVQAVGGFDIRFSPTQFDDLERDLRLGLAGWEVYYAGDVAIRHVQHSSLARAKGLTAMAQVFGNKIKLEGLYSEADVRTLAEAGLARGWDDLAGKWRELAKDFGG